MKQLKTESKINSVPKFPKSIRDEIINYTDQKDHKSFIKCLDSDTTYKLFMGAKNVSKSFGCMIETIYRIVNEPDYCCVWARNLSIDIANTIHPCFQKALDFLKVAYDLDFTPFFDIYAKVVVFKPTQQAIFFANFELVNSFAGLTLKKMNFDICDVFFDEIQQNPDELGSQLQKIYNKQPADMKFIMQATILRTKRKPNQKRRMIFLFNIYDSQHWVCQKYVNKVMPFNTENRTKLVEQTYLYVESKELDCSIMRMSRFYVPKSEIDEFQMREYEYLRTENPKLYDITIAGEPYDNISSSIIYPFKRYIYDEDNQIRPEIVVYDKTPKDKIQMVVDGYDPGLKDKNGYCRAILTTDNQIVIEYSEEIHSKNFTNFARFTTTEFLLARIVALNEYYELDQSILAIDSKEDVLIEMISKYIMEHNLRIAPIKAIKNKNPNFIIDFNISNRCKFLLECFQKQIIKFNIQSINLIEYLAKEAFNADWKRDEKINPEIYDLVNAMEYAISIFYQFVIAANNFVI